jgi:hypothetical protein
MTQVSPELAARIDLEIERRRAPASTALASRLNLNEQPPTRRS